MGAPMFECRDQPVLVSRKTTRVSSVSPVDPVSTRRGCASHAPSASPISWANLPTGSYSPPSPAPKRAGTTMLGSTALTSFAASIAPRASPPPTGMTRTSTWPRLSISSSVSCRRSPPARAPGANNPHVIDGDPHDRGLARGQAEDADAADLELTGTADLLELTL